MRTGLPLFFIAVLCLNLSHVRANETGSVVDHHAQITGALQEKFKYLELPKAQAKALDTTHLPEPVEMKPFVVSVARELTEKLKPKAPEEKALTLTKDWKPISRDIGSMHLDVGMMKYISVIPDESLPKVTLINLRW